MGNPVPLDLSSDGSARESARSPPPRERSCNENINYRDERSARARRMAPDDPSRIHLEEVTA